MFLTILRSIVSLAAISGALALVISLADHVLNNYGICKIDINEGSEVFEVEGGSSILSTLAQQKIFIPSACGAKATCGLCKVQVLEGAGPLLPTEEPYLSPAEQADHFRLACQVKIKGDVKLLIPEELFNIKEFIGTVEELKDLTHDVKFLRIKLPDDMPITFKAGQFVQLYTKPYAKVSEEVFRAYSIASAPSEQDYIDLLIRRVPDGMATTYVHDHLKEGDDIRLSGPYGDFHLRGGEEVKELIMVAGGSGMAPIRSLLKDIFEHDLPYKIRYFFTVSEVRDQFYLEELRALEEKHDNFTYIPIVSRSVEGDGWTGEKRKIVQILKDDIDGPEGREAYMCGSPGMLGACKAALMDIGFKDDQIFFDEF